MPTLRTKLQLLGISLILVLSSKIHAQSVDITNYLQETVMGVQQGYEAKLVTKKGFGLGSFYQSGNGIFFGEKNTAAYPFYGASVQVPFNQDCRVRVYGELKTGFANQKYLVVTPELTTQYRIISHVRLAVSAGYRAQEPALSAKLILTTSKE